MSNVRSALKGAILPLLAGFCMLFGSIDSAAQQNEPEAEVVPPNVFVGLFGGLSFNNHSMNLSPDWFVGGSGLPNDLIFTEGSGIRGTLGGLFEYNLSRAFGVGARISWQARGAEARAPYVTETGIVSQNPGVDSALVEGVVNSSVNYVAFTPHIRIVPESLPFYFFAGPTLLLPVGVQYDYDEEILPTNENVSFASSGSGTRNFTTGADVRETGLRVGATVGAGVELFLSDNLALIVDGQYAPMIGDLTNDLVGSESWRANAVTATVGLKVGFGGYTKKPVKREVIDTAVAVEDTIDLIKASAVTDEGLRDTLIARARKLQQTEVHAMLPYIFFDRNTDTIPPRYAKLDRRDIRYFQEERIERGNTFNVYYQLLNVIGERLRKNRGTSLTITGCVGQFEDADSGLAMRRAESVRDYLRDVWRIREDRLNVVARGLPDNPSLSEVDTLEGDVENQRVELHTSDLLVLAPVRLPDTLLLQPAGVIRLFAPQSDIPDSVAMLEMWEVNLKVGDSVIRKAETGYGAPPEHIDITLEERPDLSRHGSISITSELVILDSMFQARSERSSTQVWFVEEGGYEVKRNVEDGMYVDRYNLLLYSFDSAGVFDFSRQSDAILKERITPESKITITGHTDRIGLPPYNKKLSQRRADIAAQILGLGDEQTTIRGLGEKELLYDNDLPEGRYYSRTVTVLIETPISEKELERLEASGTVSESDDSIDAEEMMEDEAGEETNARAESSEESGMRRAEDSLVPTSATLPAPDESKE